MMLVLFYWNKKMQLVVLKVIKTVNQLQKPYLQPLKF